MIEAKNVHKSYNNGSKLIQVLKDIDLKIDKGEFAAITGPSGAGKSTLLHILGGLDTPTSGEVLFEGKDISWMRERELARMRNEKTGFVFQFYHLLPEFTAFENVLMPARIAGYGKRETGNGKRAEEEAKKLLEKVGLSHRINHFPDQLSGGEKQRVAIARSLINDPVILFCDEPTGNLDSKSGGEIIELIIKLRERNKMTVVLVTHNLELTKLADNTYYLEDGILVN